MTGGGLKTVKASNKPIWRKSMPQKLNLDSVRESLGELSDNGDSYGYERNPAWCPDETGYYQEYKPLFDDLAAGAEDLLNAISDWGWNLSQNWDDMTVALLGDTQRVLGFDAVQQDYFGMLCHAQAWAVEGAGKRVARLSKPDLLRCFGQVLTVLVSFMDIKAAHDCLISIVEELDGRSALLGRKNDEINRLYGDLTGKNGEEFDRIIEGLPQRMWVE